MPISVAICVASFMGLLLVYGLNTWLPKIMGEAGYSIKAEGLLPSRSPFSRSVQREPFR